MAYEPQVDVTSMLHLAIQKLDEKADKTADMLFNKIDKTNDKVDKLTDAVAQQAVLFEKFASMELNHRESMNRIYKRIDDYYNEDNARFINVENRLDKIENYMSNDGCPAHKNYLVSRSLQLKNYDSIIESNKERVNSLDNRLTKLENMPKAALGTIGSAVLAVFGTSLGIWILLKFGIEVPK